MKRDRHLVVVLLALLSVWGGGVLAQDRDKHEQVPDEVLKSKGLTKVGAVWVLDADAKLSEGLKALVFAKSKVDENSAAKAAVEKQIRLARGQVADLDLQHRELSQRLLNTSKAETYKRNQIIAQTDVLASRMREGAAYVEAREKELKKLESASASLQEKYASAVFELSRKMDGAVARYEELAKDDQVKAALEKLNQKPPKVRLGPSPNFEKELKFVRNHRKLVSSEVVKVQVHGNVHRVNVTFNEKVTKTMLLDSGASYVSISAATAKELGLKTGPKDPKAKLSLADGKVVEAHLIPVRTVRVGQFVVENVECAIMPASVGDTEGLLGGSFLRHFVYKLNSGAGELHMTQLSGQPAVSSASEPGAPWDDGATAATKELRAKLNDFTKQWKTVRGDWTVTVDGRLRGEGDSESACAVSLPEDVVISFKMRVLKGMRPRVRFDGTGVYFGNEGFAHELTVHGIKDLKKEAVKYGHGQEVAVKMRFQGEEFECEVDGKSIAKGKRPESEAIRLRVSGGDSWSAGLTEFWGFDASPPQRGGVAQAPVPGVLPMEEGWAVLFRSSDPAHWNKAVKEEGALAVPLDQAPKKMKYLRMRTADGDEVIIPLTFEELSRKVERKKYGWEGRGYLETKAIHLGIFDKSKPRANTGSIDVTQHPGAGYTGYGFGNRVRLDDRQGYVWAGTPVPRTVLEIAVTERELTEGEKGKLLSD